MPGSIVQINSAAQNTTTQPGTATLLSAATAGNTILIALASDDYVSTANKPSGFTEATGARQDGGGTAFLGHYVWYKVAAGGETSFSFTFTNGAATYAWIVAEVSGISTLDISNGTWLNSSSNTMTTPTVTPTAGDRFAVASIAGSLNANFNTGMGAWTNSYVEQADRATSLASGTRDNVGLATLSFTATGSAGTSTGITWDAAISPQQRTGIILVFTVAAGGGSSFTATQNDNDGLTDAAATASAFARTPTDPAGLTDTAATALVFARTQDDPVGLTDTVSVQGSGVFTRQVDDPAGLTDTATPASVFPRTVDDQTGLTDTGDPMSVDTGETIQDTAAVTDSTSVVFTTPTSRQVDDPIGLSEAVLQVTVSARQVDDTLGLADSRTVAAVFARTVDDSLGLTEQLAFVSAVTVLARTLTDSLGLSDSVSAQLLSTANQVVTDPLGLTDAIRIQQTTIRPNLGVTARPNLGVTARPYAGVTYRP